MQTAFEERRSVNRYGHDWRIGNFDTDAGLVTGRRGHPALEHEDLLQFDPERQAVT